MLENNGTKKCPYCGEEIAAEARKCRFCGEWLDGETVRYEAPGSSLQHALAEKYEIIEEIGRGGMAIVYKAVQKSLNRVVALKVIHQNLIHDKEFVARFHREAQLAARLTHPNIITIYDEGTIDNVHFIAMEYLQGRNLHEIIKTNGPLSIPDTVNIISAIADALGYAHNQGVIHRDIKSSNIMIDHTGRAVLMDFGIAHAANGTKLTQTGTIFGTPDYMSPEQAEGKKVDHRTDIYSLGVVMYECLAGHAPFTGGNPLTVLNKVIHEAPPDLSQFRQNVPTVIKYILEKALEKQRDRRFATAEEMRLALQQRTVNNNNYSYVNRTKKIGNHASPTFQTDNSLIPKNIKLAITLIRIAMGIGLLIFFLRLLVPLRGLELNIFSVVFLFATSILGVTSRVIKDGHNWARFIYLILFFINIISFLGLLITNIILGLFLIIQLFLEAVALGILFQNSSSEWFKALKKRK